MVYLTNDYISGDFNSNTLPILVRIDSQRTRNENWSKLTSGRGAGRFGKRALPLMRELAKAEKVFVRLEKRRGGSVDATFQLAGSAKALEMVANTCGETTVGLDRDGYRTVQQLLAAASFYTEPSDGVWGPASKKAMRAFQESKGLHITGAPDRDTLEALGLGTVQVQLLELEAELALQELLAAERQALDDEAQKLRDQAKAEYISQIIAKVKRNWIRPPGSATDLTCRIRVEQIPGGEVTKTEIIESSGLLAFDHTVIAAINKSSPLPQPRDPSVFARVINFTFIP